MRIALPLAACLIVLGAPPAALAQPRAPHRPLLTPVVDGGLSVRFSGMRAPRGDWIGVAAPDSRPDQYVAYRYVPAAAGAVAFPELPEGDYVARAYFGSGSYVVRAQTTRFHVPARPPARRGDETISASADGGTAFARFAGLGGSTTDWIAIGPAGAAPTSYQQWRYTGGVRDGVFEFTGLPPGQYVARVFPDWAGTHSSEAVAQSAPFWVVPAGCVCGEAATTAAR